MKKYFLNVCTLSVTFVTISAMAQDYNRGAKKELEDVEAMYPKRPKLAQRTTETVKPIRVLPAAQPSQTTVVVQQEPAAQQAPAVAAPQPIYILQQPTTNVDAAPVKESRAEQLRKQREEFEHQNESRLIERLEDDRLKSEKERLDKLLMTPAAAPTPAPAAVAPAPAPVATPVVSAPAPIPAPVPQTTVVVVPPPAEPVAAAPAETSTKAKEDVKKEDVKEEKSRFSIGGTVGIGNYPSVSNVAGAYAVGGVVDFTLPNRVAVEGTVTYSSYDIQNAGYCFYCLGNTLVTTMNQWSIGGGVKYKILPGMITPVVGGVLGYTRRDYQSRVSWGYGSNSGTGSNAFDGGLMVGAEIKCTENLSVGAEFRYMMNISYRTDNPLAYGYFGNSVYVGSPIESLNYYIAGINTKISF